MQRRPRSRKIHANLSNSVYQRLNMYALAASAAGVSVLSLAQPAEAKIVYTPAHVTIGDFALDLNHDSKVDFYLDHYIRFHSGGSISTLRVCHSGSCNSTNLGSNASNQVRGSSHGGAVALRAGAKIQKGYRFLGKDTLVPMGARLFNSFASTTLWTGQWVNGGNGVKNRYLGLKFKINGRFHFGWARLTVTTSKRSFTATLTGYAYETIAGKAIIAGKTKGPDVITPQPASLAHLATGASAIPAWRVKQTVATTH